jgi:uncharacterized protein (TIGR02145 family)
MKIYKSGFYPTPINRILSILVFPIILLSVGSCSKDYYPKQFPPVKYCPDLPVVMYGGEEYPTVLIENRCWMAKNLNIGMMIGDSLNMTNNDLIEKYCYDNDTANCNVFGGLYQWDEVMQYKSEEDTRGICPEGWHIPTNSEFVDLLIYVDNFHEYLIENHDTLWKKFGHSEFYNATGFSALPAGQRNLSTDYHSFYGIYYFTVIWCSKELDYQNAIGFEVPREEQIDGQYFNTEYGNSIRCIKDE